MNKNKFSLIALVSISLIGLNACATPGGAVKQAPMEAGNDDVILHKGDKLKVTVYGDDVMSGEFKVNSKGNAAIPLLGQTHVAGMSAEEVETMIIDTLKKRGLMYRASVTADIESPRPLYILGEVKNAGVYDFHADMTALQAVASAGGYTPRASQNNLLIDRNENGKIVRMRAYENTPVLPGDTIIARERIF